MAHRVLITGVSGFAGGFLAEHLMAEGDTVWGTSPDGAWEAHSSEAIRDRVELVAWDFRAPPSGEPGRSIGRFRPDVIYHLAGLSVPADCGTEEPTPAARAVNVGGTRAVMELARSLGRPVRVLFVSTSHVYAPVRCAAPRVDETAGVGPVTGYGRTKLEAEHEVRRLAGGGVDVVIARAFQHAGPRQNPRMMLSEWASQLASGGDRPVRVRTCEAIIDLSDVRDVVRAYRLLAHRGRAGGVYNVGSGVPRRSGQVLEILRRAARSDRPVHQVQPGRKQDPIADLRRLVADTGWRPAIPIEQTVADTWAWWCRQVRQPA